MLIIQVQHANPYYDDSYAVNSANLGPYGDAITYELIPHIEEQFRGIGEGWARFLYGGSTGGWEAFGVQVLYPDEFNGTFASCPDSLDFRHYSAVNIYNDDNAYRMQGDFNTVERPAYRDYLGNITVTMEDENHMELVIGDKSRSGGQWDIWEAVYSPLGEDGYPIAHLGQSQRRDRSRRSRLLEGKTTTCATSSSETGQRLGRSWRASCTFMSGTWITTISIMRCTCWKTFWKVPTTLTTRGRSIMAIGSSTAGMAITTIPIIFRGSVTTRTTCRKFCNALRTRHRPAPI